MEVQSLRERLKSLRDQYSAFPNNDLHIEVEDAARRAFRQLGHVQDSLEVLSEELARVDKYMLKLVEAERKINASMMSNGEAELTVSHSTYRAFASSNLIKLK